MHIKGTAPDISTISNARRHPSLASKFPELCSTFPLLVEVVTRSFDRAFRCIGPQPLAVYGLGRQCVEDFLEIVCLCENNLPSGSQKLLRGLFERTVTADGLAEESDQAQRFADFYNVSADRILRRATGAFGSISAFDGLLDECRVQEARSKFKIAKCKTCGLSPPLNWSTKSLDALAREFQQRVAARLQPGELLQAEGSFYLGGADLTNPEIHASMASIYGRLRRTSEEDTFTLVQHQNDLAPLQLGILFLVLALETQNRFFQLGLEHLLQVLNQKVHDGCVATLAPHGAFPGVSGQQHRNSEIDESFCRRPNNLKEICLESAGS